MAMTELTESGANPEHVLEPEEMLLVKNAFSVCFSHSFEKIQLKSVCNYWHKQLNWSMWTHAGQGVGQWWEARRGLEKEPSFGEVMILSLTKSREDTQHPYHPIQLQNIQNPQLKILVYAEELRENLAKCSRKFEGFKVKYTWN